MRDDAAGPDGSGLSEGLGITAPERDELTRLRQRVKAQRAELRRLNKTLEPYWTGYRNGMVHQDHTALRVKMFAAFGVPAVQAAEKAQCNCHEHKPSTITGGWWCPVHRHQL